MPSGGIPAEQSVRFRVGNVPPLAEGFSDRPDTARGILDALVPGSTIALVPGSEFAEGRQNWLGASGKTQIAVMLAETLWRSGAVDMVVWISATSRSAVLSGYVEAWVAATGIEPTGTAESVAARFVSWLAETAQPWLVVLDDLRERGRTRRALAGRAGGPAPHHQLAVGRRGQPAPDAGVPGRILQRP